MAVLVKRLQWSQLPNYTAPTGATLPSWYEINAINREGLEAAGRKYLAPQEVEVRQQAMNQEGNWRPRNHENLKPPLTELKNRQFMRLLLAVVKSSLARGDSAKVKKFFQAVNQQKLIKGYGRFHLVRGGYGGPIVIQLELRNRPKRNSRWKSGIAWSTLNFPAPFSWVDKHRLEEGLGVLRH